MDLKHLLIASSIFIVSLSAKAISGGGEWYITPSFGGTEFSQDQPADVDHKRSWDFFYNMGIGLGIKAYAQVGHFKLGIGGEYGWKEEAVEHRSASGVAEYDYQMGRFLGGAYFTAGSIMHFYAGYDPIVQSTITYEDNIHVNPFRRGDVLKGSAITAGIGFLPPNEGILMRFLGRRIVYNEAKLSDVEYELPDSTFSEMKSYEFVMHIGASY